MKIQDFVKNKANVVSGIYAIICMDTMRSYVGSSYNILQRIKQHLQQLKSGKHYNQELQKDFNAEYTYIEILEQVDDVDKLPERESYWCSYGYNLYNTDINHCKVIPELSQRDLNRLNKKINVDKSGCWIWIGSYRGKRPRFSINQDFYLTYRLVYKLYNPDWSCKHLLCHTCDNPKCVNPKHMFLGSHYSNVRDCNNKFRHSKKLNKDKVNYIRQLYLTNLMIKAKDIQKLLLQKYQLELSTVNINGILRNKIYIDTNYKYKKNSKRIALQGLEVGGSKYSREIIDDILYLREIGYKLDDVSCIISGRHKVTISYQYIHKICSHKVRLHK